MAFCFPFRTQSPSCTILDAEGLAARERLRRSAHCTGFSDESDLTIPRSSVASAGRISPTGSNLVKPNAAVLSALPVVAISASQRRFGLVCLSPRLTAIRAELRCLHRYAARSGRIAVIRDALDNIVGSSDAPTLIIEDEGHVPRALHLSRSSIVPWAEENGLRVVRMSRASACHEICGQADLRTAAMHIAKRYARLASEVLDAHGKVCPCSERWQMRQPLVTAFVLAHAYAARTVINAFGGLIPPHPTSNNYDSGHP